LDRSVLAGVVDLDPQLFVEGLDAYEDHAADGGSVQYGVGDELGGAHPDVVEAAGLAPFGQCGDDEVTSGTWCGPAAGEEPGAVSARTRQGVRRGAGRLVGGSGRHGNSKAA
jgi:hypothetical protein